jgi:hypothetical protein
VLAVFDVFSSVILVFAASSSVSLVLETLLMVGVMVVSEMISGWGSCGSTLFVKDLYRLSDDLTLGILVRMGSALLCLGSSGIVIRPELSRRRWRGLGD